MKETIYLDYEYKKRKVKGAIILVSGEFCLMFGLVFLLFGIINITTSRGPSNEGIFVFLGIGIILTVVGLILIIIYYLKFKEKRRPPLSHIAPGRRDKPYRSPIF